MQHRLRYLLSNNLTSIGYVFEADDTKNNKKVAVRRYLDLDDYITREYSKKEIFKGAPNIAQRLDFFYTVDQNKRIVQNEVFEYYSKTL